MTTLTVQKRDMETKAKKLRKEGFVTGNLFGKEMEGAIPLKIKSTDAEQVRRECVKGSQIMIDLEGTKYDVLIKELDYDPMKKAIMELDFQALVTNEKVHSTAEIILRNRDNLQDGVAEQLLKEISYTALPADLMDKVIVDCSRLKFGDTVYVKDLEIASNEKIELKTQPDTPVVTITAAHNMKVPEAETAAETAAEAK